MYLLIKWSDQSVWGCRYLLLSHSSPVSCVSGVCIRISSLTEDKASAPMMGPMEMSVLALTEVGGVQEVINGKIPHQPLPEYK